MGKLNTLILCILLLFSKTGFSQLNEEGQINILFSIPEITLVDIESVSDNNINFNIVLSNESGESPQITETSGETLWINYSSAISPNISSRSIVAEISNGELPEGLSLFVQASPYSGIGKGRLGEPAGRINLTNVPKPVITNIGNCFTGDGVNNGHMLTYTMEVSDYTLLHSVDNVFCTVLYTITDN